MVSRRSPVRRPTRSPVSDSSHILTFCSNCDFLIDFKVSLNSSLELSIWLRYSTVTLNWFFKMAWSRGSGLSWMKSVRASLYLVTASLAAETALAVLISCVKFVEGEVVDRRWKQGLWGSENLHVVNPASLRRTESSWLKQKSRNGCGCTLVKCPDPARATTTIKTNTLVVRLAMPLTKKIFCICLLSNPPPCNCANNSIYRHMVAPPSSCCSE